MSDFDYGEMKKSAERLVYVTYADMMNYTMTYYPEGLAFTQDGALVFAGSVHPCGMPYNPGFGKLPVTAKIRYWLQTTIICGYGSSR